MLKYVSLKPEYSTHGQHVIMTSDNEEIWDQGEWVVDGIPMGGFNIKPLWFLDEGEIRRRGEDVCKRLQQMI